MGCQISYGGIKNYVDGILPKNQNTPREYYCILKSELENILWICSHNAEQSKRGQKLTFEFNFECQYSSESFWEMY